VRGAEPSADPADLPLPVEPPILLRQGFLEYVVLGCEPGQVMSVPPAPEPLWLKLALEKGATNQFFDVPCPFEAQLAIVTGVAGVRLEAISRAPRTATARAWQPAGDAMIEAWRQAIVNAIQSQIGVPPTLEELWQTYLAAAGG
jgi:hypothetical protein